MSAVSIPDGQLDLWYVFSHRVTDPELLARYGRLLSDDEATRHERFTLPRLRQQFLITRALVRTVLSHYTGHDPGAWVFRENEYGKPEVARPAGLPLRFNLSHTAGLVLCGVIREHDVGVDVEDVRRRRVNLAIARRFFAPVEADVVEGLPPDQQQTAFFQFWTLKESYIKARGMGLRIPLGSFSFALSPDHPPVISFTAGCDDDPAAWQFSQRCLAGRYQVATAVRRPAGRPATIRLRETVPLSSPQ